MGQYAGMAAQIAGTEIQGWASLLEQQAMLDAINQQMAQQRYFQNQSFGQFTNKLPGLSAENATKQLGQASTTRQGQYAAANATPLALGQQGTGPTAADMAQVQLGGQNRANLGSYGDVFTNRAITQDQMQDFINRVNSRAAGSASIFPYSLNAAQNSQAMLGAIGGALSSLGGSGVNWQNFYSQQSPGQTMQGAYGSPRGIGQQYFDNGQSGQYANYS